LQTLDALTEGKSLAIRKKQIVDLARPAIGPGAGGAVVESSDIGKAQEPCESTFCDDEELRRRVTRAIKSATAGKMKPALTPEVVVGAGECHLPADCTQVQ